MNGISLLMEHLLQLLDFYLPFTRDDFIGEEGQKEDAKIILFHFFTILMNLTEVDSSIEYYADIYIQVSIHFIFFSLAFHF